MNPNRSMSLTDVICYDEDLELKATHVDVPVVDYDQVLDHSINGYGLFPVIYLDGALGYWRKYAATQFPWREANSNVVYNQWTGAAWVRSELPASWHTAYFVVMTNMSEEPVKIVMGQFAAQKLANVQAASTWEQLALENILSPELKVLYRIIVKNTNNPSIVEVQDLRSLQNIPAGTYTANDHNALTGRSALNSHPATAIGFTPIGSMSADDVQAGIEEAFLSEGVPAIDGGASNTLLVVERTGSNSLGLADSELDGGDSAKDTPDANTLARLVGGLRRGGFNLDTTRWVGAKQTIMEMIRHIDQEVAKALDLKLSDPQVDQLISNHNSSTSPHAAQLAPKNGSWINTFEVATATEDRHAVTKLQSDAQIGVTYEGIFPTEVYPDPGTNKIPSSMTGVVHDGTNFIAVDQYGQVYKHTELYAINSYAIAGQYFDGLVPASPNTNMDYLTIDPATGYLIVFWKTNILSSEDGGLTWILWPYVAPQEIRRWTWGKEGLDNCIIGGYFGFVAFNPDFVYANAKVNAAYFVSPPNPEVIADTNVQDVSSSYYDGQYRYAAICANGLLFYNSGTPNQNWAAVSTGVYSQNARFARVKKNAIDKIMLLVGNNPASVRLADKFVNLQSVNSEIQSSSSIAASWSNGIHELTDDRLLVSTVGSGASGSYWYLSRSGGQFYIRGFVALEYFNPKLVVENPINGEVSLIDTARQHFATITKNP